jgi:hypothetical protein
MSLLGKDTMDIICDSGATVVLGARPEEFINQSRGNVVAVKQIMIGERAHGFGV